MVCSHVTTIMLLQMLMQPYTLIIYRAPGKFVLCDSGSLVVGTIILTIIMIEDNPSNYGGHNFNNEMPL